MIRHLLFDLDGTLADTAAANFAAYREAFAARGLVLREADHEGFVGLPLKVFARRLDPQLTDADVRALSDAKALIYPRCMGLVRPNTALLAFARAQARRQSLAVVTTARRENAEAVLACIGASDLFPVRVFGDDVSEMKPSPEAYLLCLERLGAKASECLAFEDSPAGVAAAEAAGIAVVTVGLDA
jgi:beta-phosphoglucomutase-like phosphatase (HAD superfamily)